MANMIAVEILKEMVDGYKFLSLDDLRIENVEELLMKRDDDVFAERWGMVDCELGRIRKDRPGELRYGIPIKERKYIESIEEELYFRVYNSCKDDDLLIYYDDLSAYISDDFGLIAEGLYFGYNNAWLNGLLYEYIEHRIPCGDLKEIEGDLYDMLMNYYEQCNK